MFNKFFISLFILLNVSLNVYSDEKQLILNRLININNITFDFKQITNNKKESGTCVLVFDNKLSCDYDDFAKKRILIKGKTLVVQQKSYNKIYLYPVSNSPFIKIFNKKELLNLIKNSNYQFKENIELTYIDKNKKKIIIFFRKDNYELVGWKVVDKLQNIINFSIKIKYINSEINPKIFKIPSIN